MSTLQTRKPTGKPPWPLVLLAGKEKTGKSYNAALASSSDQIGRALWVGIGEDDPDEYGAIPGADFEIVEHDGTFPEIGRALRAAVDEPDKDGKPTLIILDSMTRLWELIQDEIQAMANSRRKNAAQDAPISMDLWNLAKRKRWQPIMNLLREHDGPVILTARLDEVTTMDQNGQPSKQKDWKVQAEKSLPYDVQAVVQLREPGHVVLTGVKSLAANIPLGQEQRWDDFTVAGLWEAMGIKPDAVDQRRHSAAEFREPPVEQAQSAASPAAAASSRQSRQEDPVTQALRNAWDDLEKLRLIVRQMGEGHPLYQQAVARGRELAEKAEQAKSDAPPSAESGHGAPVEGAHAVQESIEAELVEEDTNE